MRHIKIDEDPDFILSNKYSNSLKKFLDQNPNGASDSTICRMLDISQEELDAIYASAMQKLKAALTS
jgi:hypothetical protein